MGRKTSRSEAPHGDNEIKTTLSSVFFFSFSDWPLLIRGSWLPITCFQSHFELAAGDPTWGMFFKRVGGGQGEKEGLWWLRGRGGEKKHLNGKLVKISSCLRSRSDKVFGSVASRHHFKIDSWLCTAYYWCQCCLCSSANYIRSGVVIVQDQNVLFLSLGESSLMKNILELL